jgi:hypothetical protein
MAQVTVNIDIITRFEHAFRAADQATIDEHRPGSGRPQSSTR